MKTALRIRPAVSSLITLILLPALAHAVTEEAGFLNPALNPGQPAGPEPKPSQAIPWSQIGATAGAQYQGDGLSIRPTGDGAVLRCVFQKLEGEATPEGLWLTSTAPGGAKDRFRVVATAVGRVGDSERGPLSPREPEPRNSRTQRSALLSLPANGIVQITDYLVRFIRPSVIEEYSVSMDGVRQDFIIERPPVGKGTSNIQSPTLNSQPSTINREELRVELAVSGARVETTAQGARLLLERSGRKIAYSRLRVTDATGRELPARMEIVPEGARHSCRFGADENVLLGGFLRALESSDVKRAEARAPQLAILVNDAEAVYPVRIDPTFSDENWISMGGILGANDRVYAATADTSGNLYIGGDFTTVGDVVANYIVKWDGNAWSALGSGMNDSVSALFASGTELYAGGDFTIAGGTEAHHIAKWDGDLWYALGSGMNNTVLALMKAGTNLFAGGDFSSAGEITANRVAQWNGNAWSALGSGMNNTVYALAISGTNLYAGGSFRTASGSAANRVANWNGSLWSPLGLGMNDDVHALAVSGTNLYVGGAFSRATNSGGLAVTVNRIAKWNGSSWSALGSGLEGGVLGPRVWTLAVSGDELYAGGWFTEAGGMSANYVAKWDGTAWSALGAGTDWYVYAIAAFGAKLYVGGDFTSAGETEANRIANWDGDDWSALGSPSGLNGGVNALALMDTDLYVGGWFTGAGTNQVNRIAKWDGSNWSPLGSGMDDEVHALAVSGTNLYAGGEFTTAGETEVNQIAKWDGSAWSALGDGMSGGGVYALAVSGTNLYAGGDFSSAGGTPAECVARWDGSAWWALGAGMGGSYPGVYALAVSGTNLYAGGDFTTADGSPAARIAKWNGSSWSALGTGMNQGVRALVLSGANLYAGGEFTTAGGQPVNHVARWDGSGWSALGSGVDGPVYALTVLGADLYAGGYFGEAGARWIVKWDEDSWSTLGSVSGGGEGTQINALMAAGANLYVGGYFTTVGGKVSARVAKAILIVPANVISSFLDSSDFVARFDGTPGITYTIEQTPAAAPPNWQKLTNLTAPTNCIFELRDAVQPSGQRFYRAVYPAY